MMSNYFLLHLCITQVSLLGPLAVDGTSKVAGYFPRSMVFVYYSGYTPGHSPRRYLDCGNAASSFVV